MAVNFQDDEYKKYPVPTTSPSPDVQPADVTQTTVTPAKPSVFTDGDETVNTTATGSASIFPEKKVNSQGTPAANHTAIQDVTLPETTSPTPKTAGEMTPAERYKAKYPEATLAEIIDLLEDKIQEGTILDYEKEILDVLKLELAENEKVDKGSNVVKSDDIEPAGENKISNLQYNNVKSEYESLYSKPGTEYEKTSRVIDKYLIENDSEYAELRPAQKRTYRDSYIASMREKLGYSKNITQAQRDIMQKEIAMLFIDAAASGTPLTKQSSARDVQSRLDAINNNRSEQLMNFKLDETKSVNEQLHDIVDFVLTQNDAKYAKITDPIKKQEYVDSIKGQMSEQLLKININAKNLKPEEKEAISRLAISAFKTMQKRGTTLKQLTKDSDLQNQFLAQVLTDNKDIISKIENAEIKKSFEVALTKADIYNEIKINNPQKIVRERDILNKLSEMNKNGELKSEALKELYEVYTNLEKLDSELKAKNPNANRLLDDESNMTSLASMSVLAGMTPQKFLEVALCDKDGNSLTGDALEKKLVALKQIVGEGKDVPGVMILREQLLKTHSSEEVDRLLVKSGIYNKKSHLHTLAHAGMNMSEKIARESANQTNAISAYGTEQQINEIKENASVAASVVNSSAMTIIQTNLSNSAYSIFANDFNTGVHQYYTQEQQDYFRNSMIAQDVPAERRTAFTKSYLITGNEQQQLHDAQYFSTVKDAAVTEGMASAVPHIENHEVRNTVNSYVDNAIKNNGYSSDEINNINTARETGQTSYERTSPDSESISKTNSTSNSNSASNISQTTANTTATATVSATANATSDSSQKVKVSTTNSTAVTEMKVLLAQINYEHSIALRDKAIADLERIIDKIQNDQEVRAQKQAELAAKESKTDEEIAQAIKDAAAKSVEPQDKTQKEIAKEVIDELEEDEKLEKKYNIPIETIKELQVAQRQGDLSKIYSKLGSISVDAQKHFIQYLSRKDTATIIGFIRSRSSDKSLIRELCRLNPSLIRILEPDLLESCGIAKADIIKYASPSHLAMLMYDLAKTGKIDQLKQFIEALGDDAPDFALNSRPVPGDDRFYAMHNTQQVPISSFSPAVVGHSKFSKGQTRQTIRPQDYPDYREFLA